MISLDALTNFLWNINLPVDSSVSGECSLSCRSFDEAGDGYGRGEGFAVVVLRQAERSHKSIGPIICSSAVNQDGRSSGLTAPNGPSQSRLIQQALTGGGVPGSEVGLVAVHGTGTPLGDPIEVGALGHGFGVPGAEASLTLVSNKSCFGHTEGAAGSYFTCHLAL